MVVKRRTTSVAFPFMHLDQGLAKTAHALRKVVWVSA